MIIERMSQLLKHITITKQEAELLDRVYGLSTGDMGLDEDLQAAKRILRRLVMATCGTLREEEEQNG